MTAKEYLMNELGKKRYELGISQAEMASKLEISAKAVCQPGDRPEPVLHENSGIVSGTQRCE